MGRKKYSDPRFKKKFFDLYSLETTAQLAEKFGVNPQAVTEWKKGNIPDVGTLVSISKDKNISLDYLLGDAPPHSLDGDYKSASMVTGLSEKTIKALNEWFDGYGVIMLNRFVESGHFEALMLTLIKGFKVIQSYGNDAEDIPTKDDWIGYYSNEMGSVLNAFMWDALKEIADTRITEKILTRMEKHIKSLTPEQIQARKDVWGADFWKNMFEESQEKEIEV